MSPDRRTFLAGALATGGMALSGMGRAAAQGAAGPLIFDAMGEMRLEYDGDLIKQIKASGLNAITVTLTDPKVSGQRATDEAIDAVLAHDQHIKAHPEWFLKATRVEDIERARAAGQIAVFYLYQNSVQFQKDLDLVDMFYSLGVRSSQITYNYQNWAGAGCKEKRDGGLSRFGGELVEKMNETGMLIDLSHSGMTTMADTIAVSKSPVCISHTGIMSVFENERNTTDENLRAVAKNGGFVGVCQIRPFLTHGREGALEDYFRHIDQAVNVAGVEHVAIGSDRDHRVITMTDEYLAELKAEEGENFNPDEWPLFIDELNGPSRMEVILAGLEKRGYAQADIEKIMGGNVLRVYRDVVG